jgi:hypothetical protein
MQLLFELIIDIAGVNAQFRFCGRSAKKPVGSRGWLRNGAVIREQYRPLSNQHLAKSVAVGRGVYTSHRET